MPTNMLVTKQLAVVLAMFSCCAQLTNASCFVESDPALQEFVSDIEALVLNTSDRALIVTRDVYLNLNRAFCPELRLAIDDMLQHYVRQVNAMLNAPSNYTQKRLLLQRFRSNNRQIEQLSAKLNATAPTQLPFQLISESFYNEEKNSTAFDNLYLDFMNEFGRASRRLWQQMSEETVEQHEELLEILDEIANESQLREKDKLFDEFIELYLFRDCQAGETL